MIKYKTYTEHFLMMLHDFFTSMLIFDRDKLYELPRKLVPIELDNRKELKKKLSLRYLPTVEQQQNTFKLKQLLQSKSLERLTKSYKLKRTASGSLNIGNIKPTKMVMKDPQKSTTSNGRCCLKGACKSCGTTPEPSYSLMKYFLSSINLIQSILRFACMPVHKVFCYLSVDTILTCYDIGRFSSYPAIRKVSIGYVGGQYPFFYKLTYFSFGSEYFITISLSVDLLP